MSLAKVFIVIAAVFAVSNAAPKPEHHVPVVKHGAPSHSHIAREDSGYGNSHFNYGIVDGYTGDVHSRDEKTNNHQVHGTYALGDPNGYERRVNYVADYGGVRQNVHGSENGLYVHSPDFQITPNAVPAKKLAPYSATLHGHGHAANYGSHGYTAPAYGGHGYGAPAHHAHSYGAPAYGGHGYAAVAHGGYGPREY